MVQELIYSPKNRKANDGYMVIKIDLEKACDRPEWSFIKMVLEHFGFPQNITNLIMSCISTTTDKCNFYMIFVILLFIKIVSFPLFLLI